MSPGKCRPFCLSLNVLTHCYAVTQQALNLEISISTWILLKFLSPVDKISAFSSSNGLPPDRQQVITWTNDDPLHRCICESPSLKLFLELTSAAGISLIIFLDLPSDYKPWY